MEYSLCPNCFKESFDGKVCVNCKYEPKDERGFELEPFTILDSRYIVGRVIGAGGFGITYVAYDILNDKRCAIKEYFPSGAAIRESNTHIRVSISEYREEFRHGLTRFIEEAKILQKLSHIPCVVDVMDYFEYNGTAYYVMKYLQGSTLKKLIVKSGSGLGLELSNQIITQVGKTIDRIHKETGFLHRDISPENIMILDSGEIYLIDFGSARNYFMNNSGYTITLKHGFAPFEQYSSTGKQGSYTDLYALASTYYYMLTGKMIPRATDRVGGVAYTPLVDMNKGISKKISDAVDKALAVKASERTQTVAEFLEEIAEGTKSTTVPVSNRKKPYIIIRIDGEDKIVSDLQSDKLVTIGASGQKSEIVMKNCTNISRLHCKVRYDNVKGKFQIEDCSLNGTYINNVRMSKNVIYTLNDNDVVMLVSNRYRLIFGVK